MASFMRLISVVVPLLLATFAAAPAGAATPKASPVNDQHAVCVDTPLRLAFDQPPSLGTSGAIEVHRADGSIADSIDLGDPASYQRTVGDAVSDTGVLHEFAYFPVIVTGDTAAIYLHHELDYGQTYYVTIDPGVFTGFAGIQDPDAWHFTTRLVPPLGPGPLTVSAAGGGDSAPCKAQSTSCRKGTRSRSLSTCCRASTPSWSTSGRTVRTSPCAGRAATGR
jgi:hypothetical protein